MADPDSAELFSSSEEAEKALAVRLDRWKAKGWSIVAHEDEENRYTVSDDTGQFIGEFYIED